MNYMNLIYEFEWDDLRHSFVFSIEGVGDEGGYRVAVGMTELNEIIRQLLSHTDGSRGNETGGAVLTSRCVTITASTVLLLLLLLFLLLFLKLGKDPPRLAHCSPAIREAHSGHQQHRQSVP